MLSEEIVNSCPHQVLVTVKAYTYGYHAHPTSRTPYLYIGLQVQYRLYGSKKAILNTGIQLLSLDHDQHLQFLHPPVPHEDTEHCCICRSWKNIKRCSELSQHWVMRFF
jgi:hypothetical protein